MTRSEENGGVACLDWLQGPVTRFPKDHRDTTGAKLGASWGGTASVRNRLIQCGTESMTRISGFVHTLQARDRVIR